MRSLVPFALIAITLPAVAGESQWQEIAPDVSVRLISTGQLNADGTGLFGIEIDMPPNVKTYWRMPGQTGLKAELDFSASPNVQLQQMHWPLPQREVKSGYLDYVYYGHTILPFTLAISDASQPVQLSAVLGICSEVCIPAQAQFLLPATDATPDRGNGLRLRQTMAEVPIAWDGAGEPIGPITYDANAKSIALNIDPQLLEPDSIIVTADAEDVLFAAPQKSLSDDLVLLPILSKTDNSDVEGMDVTVTFMTDMGAYEVSRKIGTL